MHLVSPVAAAEDAPARTIERHWQAFLDRDLDGLVADYTEDAVFITPDGILEGKAQIRGLFAAVLEDFSAPEASAEIVVRRFFGPIAYVNWKAESPRNRYELITDTFVVESGLIRYQTYAAHITPK